MPTTRWPPTTPAPARSRSIMASRPRARRRTTPSTSCATGGNSPQPTDRVLTECSGYRCSRRSSARERRESIFMSLDMMRSIRDSRLLIRADSGWNTNVLVSVSSITAARTEPELRRGQRQHPLVPQPRQGQTVAPANPRLLKDVLEVDLHRAWANPELRADVPVLQPLLHQFHHLQFARGQVRACALRRALGLLQHAFLHPGVPRGHRAHAFEQRLYSSRLANDS